LYQTSGEFRGVALHFFKKNTGAKKVTKLGLELDHHGTWLGKRWVPAKYFFHPMESEFQISTGCWRSRLDDGDIFTFFGRITNAGYGKEHLE